MQTWFQMLKKTNEIERTLSVVLNGYSMKIFMMNALEQLNEYLLGRISLKGCL